MPAAFMTADDNLPDGTNRNSNQGWLNTSSMAGLEKVAIPKWMWAQNNHVYYDPNVDYLPPPDPENPASNLPDYPDAQGRTPNDAFGVYSAGDATGGYGYFSNPYKSDAPDIDLTKEWPELQYCTHDRQECEQGTPYECTPRIECKPPGLDRNDGDDGNLQSWDGFKYIVRSAPVYYAKYNGVLTRVQIKPKTDKGADAIYVSPDGKHTRSYNEELRNFANWYAYYHTRLQAARSASLRAFNQVCADDSQNDCLPARMGFITISWNAPQEYSSKKFIRVADFDTAQKQKFMRQIRDNQANAGTPLPAALSNAGRYFAGKVDRGSDSDDPMQYSCQKNYAILMTDGFWKDNNDGIYDLNGTSHNASYGTFPNLDQNLPRPCHDPQGGKTTLADVAAYYWGTDLRTPEQDNCTGALGNDICANNVPSSGENANEDDIAADRRQRMTTFTVGMGLDGLLPWRADYKSAAKGSYRDIVDGLKDWPKLDDNNLPTYIDDLWHTAVNGRGRYYSAADPQSLVDGLQDALGAIRANAGSAAAPVADDPTRAGTGQYVFSASYDTSDWHGDLVRQGLFDASAPRWSAAALLKQQIAKKGFESRNIWTAPNGQSFAIPFDITYLATAQAYFGDHLCDPDVPPGSRSTCLSQFAGDAKASASATNLIDWLRGDPTWEKTLYRARSTPLGDIVHSSPVFLDGTPKLVLAAANDGMLHAFNADTGEEEWAWIPDALLPELWQLADKNWRSLHHFLLDGPVQVAEADGKTVLIGSFGAGATGYYALDLSDRLNPQLLWNFEDPKAGYAFNPAKVVKANGKWAALLPSGANPADGTARLFVVDLFSGKLEKTFELPAGGADNGLMSVAAYLPGGVADPEARWAFGGDLKGNLWRFDLASEDSKSTALAKLDVPITAEPVVSLENGEVVLYVGTGQYLGKPDLEDKNSRQQYLEGLKAGILKDGTAYADTAPEPDAALSISESSIKGKEGWTWAGGTGFSLALPEKARIYQKAELAFGLLAALSVTPENGACTAGGKSTLYLIDTKTGKGELRQFDKSIVGMQMMVDKNSKFFLLVQYGDGTVGKEPVTPPNLPAALPGGGGKRLMWRQLLNE
jgi:type IV pilus assembly protein PilY1